MNVIDQPWFPVGAPWGDATWINAGSEDPHGGTPVCDCTMMVGEFRDRDRSQQEAAELAAHIAKVHNTDLARRVVERKMGVRD